MAVATAVVKKAAMGIGKSWNQPPTELQPGSTKVTTSGCCDGEKLELMMLFAATMCAFAGTNRRHSWNHDCKMLQPALAVTAAVVEKVVTGIGKRRNRPPAELQPTFTKVATTMTGVSPVLQPAMEFATTSINKCCNQSWCHDLGQRGGVTDTTVLGGRARRTLDLVVPWKPWRHP